VTISDLQETILIPKSIFLFDESNSIDPLTQFGIEKCSIRIFGQNNLQSLKKNVQKENVFYIGCDQDNLTSYILSPKIFNLTWYVDGLIPN
jgi:hypothetical protein